jgi:hypothetical protein
MIRPLAHAGLLVAVMTCVLQAQAPPDESGSPEPVEEPSTKTTYEDLPEYGGGPGAVGEELEDDASAKTPAFRFDTLRRSLDSYFDFKAKIHEDLGLAFGVDYTALYLHRTVRVRTRPRAAWPGCSARGSC